MLPPSGAVGKPDQEKYFPVVVNRANFDVGVGHPVTGGYRRCNFPDGVISDAIDLGGLFHKWRTNLLAGRSDAHRNRKNSR